ncbi:hypothetical protein [Bradyrhizobium sp. RT5a]|uniref:hypothetical protein n=1 Tax=Bradyrhizobium sp. RT5a TaxID=3156380 RepID=UPI00339AD961
MTDILEAAFEPVNILKALKLNFGWLVHVSPDIHLASIRDGGLKPSRDAPVPPDLDGIVSNRHILCLHPLGAKVCPLPVCKSAEDGKDINLVTFAVANEHFPHDLQTDWSNAWEFQSGRIELYKNRGVDFVARHLVTEFGSIVSYSTIPPDQLRVFCNGAPPADPSRWPKLPGVTDEEIYRYREPS